MSDGTEIINKLKAALLTRGPWIDKDANIAEVMRELEDFIVWDHLLRPANEPPRDNASGSAVTLLEGLTLDDSTTSSSTTVRPSTGPPASTPTTISSPSDAARPSTGHPATTSDIAASPSEDARPSTDSATSRVCAKHTGPSTTVTAREKRDPCYYPAFVYSRDDRWDLGLCKHAFDGEAQCPKGADCLWRHHALTEWDLAACPAIQPKKHRKLLKGNLHQDEQFTRWDQRTG